LGGGVAQPPLPRAGSRHVGTGTGDLRHMAKIDLSKVSVTEANEALPRQGDDPEDFEVPNPDAKHHIGVGLVDPITVRVRGSAGYFCAGLTDGPPFEGENNFGWGAGD